MSIRPVKKLLTAKPTLEGAGVHLRRAFGFGQTSDYDPFLLLDDFRNDVPADYLAGLRVVKEFSPNRPDQALHEGM
jgi:quercetin 2,3-dioxygenase